MMPKIEIGRNSKNHAIVLVDGEEFCTLYGSDWRKRFKRLHDALCLAYTVKTQPMTTINTVIKEIRKK